MLCLDIQGIHLAVEVAKPRVAYLLESWKKQQLGDQISIVVVVLFIL